MKTKLHRTRFKSRFYLKLLSAVIFNTIFTLPVLVLVFYACSSMWKFPEIIPGRFDFRSFDYLIKEAPGIIKSLISSLIYSLCTVLTTFMITVLPASVFARYRFPFHRLLEGLFLAPALIPAMAFSMGIHILFIKTGLSDTLAGVVLVLSIVSYPYMLRALTAGFQSYGLSYTECARNLGAGFFRTLLKVEIPLLIPAIVSGGSVVFLVSFSEYFLVFLIGGGSVPSYTGYLFPFLNSSDRSMASLLTLIFLLLPVTLFFLIDIIIMRIYRKKGVL